MIDRNLIRTNPELVKENIRKKFQEQKLKLVDEVIELDQKFREAKSRGDTLRSQRNAISKEIGGLMAKGLKEEAEQTKAKVAAISQELADLKTKEEQFTADIRERMLVIPNIIDASVFPSARTTARMWRLSALASPSVPDFEIPYHVDIMEALDGVDLDSARKTSGNGFYYLTRRHCAPAFGHPLLCPGFHDRPGLHLLYPPLHDPQQRGYRRHELF